MTEDQQRSVVVLMLLERGYEVVSVLDAHGQLHYEIRRGDRIIIRAQRLSEIAAVIGQYALDVPVNRSKE